MAGSVTYTFASGATVDPAELNQNFTDLLALLSNLTAANSAASAGYTNAQLANSEFEVVINLGLNGTQMLAPVAAGDKAVFATIPYDATAGVQVYTILQAEWILSVVNTPLATPPQFRLWKGNETDTWTELTNGAIAPGATSAVGRATLKANPTLTTSVTRPQYLALEVDAVAVGSDEQEYFTLSVKLKEALRS